MICVQAQNANVKNTLILAGTNANSKALVLKIQMETFRGSEKMWTIFFGPELKTTIPNISAAVAAKIKSQQAAQATSNVLKFISGGGKM